MPVPGVPRVAEHPLELRSRPLERRSTLGARQADPAVACAVSIARVVDRAITQQTESEAISRRSQQPRERDEAPLRGHETHQLAGRANLTSDHRRGTPRQQSVGELAPQSVSDSVAFRDRPMRHRSQLAALG